MCRLRSRRNLEWSSVVYHFDSLDRVRVVSFVSGFVLVRLLAVVGVMNVAVIMLSLWKLSLDARGGVFRGLTSAVVVGINFN